LDNDRVKLRLFIVALTALLSGCALFSSSDNYRVVTRIIDGDTIQLENHERVRLIGVDTPESVDPRRLVEHFGKEAAIFTQRMVLGRRVRLEFDQANAAGDHKDNTPQRRTLAYVYLEDGTFLNAEIVRQGFGHVLMRYPFQYMEEFRQLERDAREQGRGLWARQR
jgi:micrococcal nuclease